MNKAINPPTLASFYNSQAMARYFAQAQRKDAEAAGSSSKPGPGYVGAIYDKYLKHKMLSNWLQAKVRETLNNAVKACGEYLFVDDVNSKQY